MLENIDLTNVLVLDIETVSGFATYAEMSPVMQKLWDIKARQVQARKPEEERLSSEEAYTELAGIYAEFGKIVCISVGIFAKDKDGGLQFRLKSYYDHDEKKLLEEFSQLLDARYSDTRKIFLCGHNIKEFDAPFTCRRLVINRLPLPKALDIPGKKPWELAHLLDTMTVWKFGDYKSYSSLKLLCGVFDIPTPKDDIDGSEVGKTYWVSDELDRIEVYCKKDVLATARLLMAYQGLPIIEDEQVIIT
ncbi:MAG: ribonuclease H-like domain-containing protein [Aureispira sp.]